METVHATDSIRAYVVLKPDENTDLTRNRVKAQLEQRGIPVRRVSRSSIIVEAPPEQLEAVFHGELEPGSEDGYWRWAKRPMVPADLQSSVEDVVLPLPIKPV